MARAPHRAEGEDRLGRVRRHRAPGCRRVSALRHHDDRRCELQRRQCAGRGRSRARGDRLRRGLRADPPAARERLRPRRPGRGDGLEPCAGGRLPARALLGFPGGLRAHVFARPPRRDTSRSRRTSFATSTGRGPDRRRERRRAVGDDSRPPPRRARAARPQVLAAHCVKVDEEEIGLLAAHDVAVAHCPRSNALLGCGVAPLAELLAAGVRVGLGTDSPASTPSFDFFEEMRAALYAARARAERPDALSARDALKLATPALRAHSASTTRSGRSLRESAATSRSSRSPDRPTCPGRIPPRRLSSEGLPSGCG